MVTSYFREIIYYICEVPFSKHKIKSCVVTVHFAVQENYKYDLNNIVVVKYLPKPQMDLTNMFNLFPVKKRY